ncbi:MAG: hypothetical protein K9J42_12935 [Sulfuritalea sp.]|nr:hypothetical protein [Sulfuritalea sp.]
MIFINPRGAPELACDHCGCRWVDRTNGNHCYECGNEIPDASVEEFQRALTDFAARLADQAAASPAESSGNK